MDYHTWQTTLTVKTNSNTFRDVRDWLEEHARPVPSRDDDALAKYLRCVIVSNSEWDNVSLEVELPRPRLVCQPWPWLQGYEDDDAPLGAAMPDECATARHRQFAVGSFALLGMLTVGGSVWIAHLLSPPEPPPLPVSYNAHHGVAPYQHARLAQDGD